MLNKLITSVAEAGRELLRREGKVRAGGRTRPQMAALCRDLLSSKGEALGTALACSVVDACRAMDADQTRDFFAMLLEDFSSPVGQVESAVAVWQANPSRSNLHALHRCSEPPRQELFRRMNMAPGGTSAVVALRAALLELLPDNPELEEVDLDLRHLMTSWFNRGFLQLRHIDWRTPAHLLEKLMAYEAVHAMEGWEDLRRRLAEDRRCFAFFHPAMEDEPLIFVEVALTRGLANSVQALLDAEVNTAMQAEADTAIFYSISDCQQGLRGISLGNFLIKQVVMELRDELPNLKQFATLSPIPGFSRWLRQRVEQGVIPEEQLQEIASIYAHTRGEASRESPAARELLSGFCADYLYNAKRGDKPLDPVARFHLRNGASIRRLNWAGDLSAKGIADAVGIMVNYEYDLKRVESRHEDFVNRGLVAAEKEFLKCLPKDSLVEAVPATAAEPG